jgi:hypothetical protein
MRRFGLRRSSYFIHYRRNDAIHSITVGCSSRQQWRGDIRFLRVRSMLQPSVRRMWPLLMERTRHITTLRRWCITNDANLFEADMTYIGLSSIDFDGTSDYSSKKENFLVPTLHFASKKLGDSNARVGLSVVVPAGLSKRWDHAIPKATAEEFTLETVEINPSIAIPVNETVSLELAFV